MKLKLLIILSVISGAVCAQTKLSRTISDYISGKFEECHSLVQLERDFGERFNSGGSIFSFISGDKKLDKKIKEEIRIIDMKDSLFVNCWDLWLKKEGMLGHGYAPAIRIDNQIFFYSTEVNRTNYTANGMMYGVVGGIMRSLVESACYARFFKIYRIKDDSGEVYEVTKEYVRAVLVRNEELFSEYQKEKKPEKAKTILAYLKRLAAKDLNETEQTDQTDQTVGENTN